MVKISKELFVDTLEKIKKGIDRENKASDAIESIIDGFAVITISDDYKDALFNLLHDVMDDKHDLVFWWLYENAEKTIWIGNGKDRIAVDVSTPELLYDYLNLY